MSFQPFDLCHNQTESIVVRYLIVLTFILPHYLCAGLSLFSPGEIPVRISTSHNLPSHNIHCIMLKTYTSLKRFDVINLFPSGTQK